MQKSSAWQTRGSGIEGHETRAAQVCRSGGEETVGKVRGRKLVEQVERLFHRGVMLELDPGVSSIEMKAVAIAFRFTL